MIPEGDSFLLDDEDSCERIPRGWFERYMERQRIVDGSTDTLTEIQGMILTSCLARGDTDGAKRHIQDWNAKRARGKSAGIDISKWTPGEHFYALDKKFLKLDDAISYLRERGKRFSGHVQERFAYRENGG